MPTFTEAWEEAAAACPPSVKQYDTLEIWHPSFDAPVRIVANVGDDMNFSLENGAPFDGGQSVLFTACPLSVGWPEVRQGQVPQSKVSIDNVNRLLMPKIREALKIRAYITIIFRQYLSSDLTVPAYGPVGFLLKEVQAVAATITGNVVVSMLTAKGFPKQDKNYTTTQFSSLLPG